MLTGEVISIPLDRVIFHAILNTSSHMNDLDEASQHEDASVRPEDLVLRCKAVDIKPSIFCGRTR